MFKGIVNYGPRNRLEMDRTRIVRTDSRTISLTHTSRNPRINNDEHEHSVEYTAHAQTGCVHIYIATHYPLEGMTLDIHVPRMVLLLGGQKQTWTKTGSRRCVRNLRADFPVRGLFRLSQTAPTGSF